MVRNSNGVKALAAGLSALAGVMALPAGMAQAQEYPTKIIRLIIPFPGGSASDVLTRIVADGLSARLGQRVLVENKPGAAGTIGSGEAARAAPDGYTLLIGASGPLATNKTLMKKLSFLAERDFEAISLLASMPNVLVVNPVKVPVRTVKEFIEFVSKHPGDINYSSIGNGTSQHLAGAMFEHRMKLKMRHVPYRDAGQIAIDLLSGQVQSTFQLIPNVAGHLGEGKLRPVAIMAQRRSPALPDTPTMAEQGFPDLISSAWFGLFAPKNTPRAIIERLNKESVAMIADPKIAERIIKIGADPESSTPAALAKLLSDDVVKWRDVITAAGISIN